MSIILQSIRIQLQDTGLDSQIGIMGFWYDIYKGSAKLVRIQLRGIGFESYIGSMGLWRGMYIDIGLSNLKM